MCTVNAPFVILEAALISVSGELGIRNKFIFITSECFLPRYIVHTSSFTVNITKFLFKIDSYHGAIKCKIGNKDVSLQK